MDEPRIAPPDKAAEILRARGYPVGAKLLRKLYVQGKLPGLKTDKRLLIPIEKAVELFENGELQEPQSDRIRRVS